VKIELIPDGFKIIGHELCRVGPEPDLVCPEPHCAVVADRNQVLVVLEPGLSDIREVVEDVARVGRRYLYSGLTQSHLDAIRQQIDLGLKHLFVTRVVYRLPGGIVWRLIQTGGEV
jgi:hypothetical protein